MESHDLFILHRNNKPDMRFKKRKNGQYSFYVRKITRHDNDNNVDDVDPNVNNSDANFISRYDNKINDNNSSQGVHPEITGVVIEANGQEHNKCNDDDLQSPPPDQNIQVNDDENVAEAMTQPQTQEHNVKLEPEAMTQLQDDDKTSTEAMTQLHNKNDDNLINFNAINDPYDLAKIFF